MLKSIRNIFAIPDLRKRVIFTLLLLAVYRLGAQIPIPGINAEALFEFFKSAAGGFLGFVDLFAGRALSRMSIFALGIMPYISASIILELLVVVWPYLEKLKKEGELGQKKITQMTRYGTVVICLVQGLGMAIGLERATSPTGQPVVMDPGWGFRFITVITFMAGTIFIMWLGEQITERGIGNGISLIIFSGIVVGLPRGIADIVEKLRGGEMSPLKILFLLAFMLVVTGFIVFVERGQRRIPVSYAKRVQGRKIYGGQSTHLPIKVNTGGVIPIIFASSVITFPATIAGFIKHPIAQSISRQLSFGMPLYVLLYLAGIVFFTYFYISIIYNPQDVSENLRKYSGFIPGIRPGKNTADYIDSVLSHLTFIGAIYLAVVALSPEFLMAGVKVDTIPFIGDSLDAFLPKWFTQGMNVNFYFGGTSLLIVIGVAMDTLNQIESQLVMRNYESFLGGRTRLRGRR